MRIYKLDGFLRNLVPSPSTRAISNMKKGEKLKLKDEHREYMRNVIGKIYKTLKYSSWESAEQELNNMSLRWDSYTVNQVLKSHPPMEKAWLFFNWASSLRGFKHDHYTYTTMLDIFGEAGRVSSIKLDSVTYTSMMHWLSRKCKEALEIFEKMQEAGAQPDKAACNILIQRCSKVGGTEFMTHILQYMKENRLVLRYPVFVEALEALKFLYSVTMGISIERTGYLSLIGLLIRSNMFSKLVEIVEEMTRAGYSLGTYLASLLIIRLGCAKKHTLAMKIFNLLPDNHKCTATFTALISVYFSVRRVTKALEIYKIMCTKGFCPVLGTYDVLIAGFETNGKYAEAEHYRKAKKSKSLHANSGSQESVCIEGKICNLLFSVDVVL
ncbi:Pentatricopeptide repeat-containing protein [Glycine max]|nr:Pentatricopeptide repeat-containing protein [Glycine max]